MAYRIAQRMRARLWLARRRLARTVWGRWIIPGAVALAVLYVARLVIICLWLVTL